MWCLPQIDQTRSPEGHNKKQDVYHDAIQINIAESPETRILSSNGIQRQASFGEIINFPSNVAGTKMPLGQARNKPDAAICIMRSLRLQWLKDDVVA